MSLKTIYENNKNRKNQVVDYISEDFIIKTNIKNIWNYHKYLTITLTAVTILLLIITFNNINIIFSEVLLILSIILLFIFFNSYLIIAKNNELSIRTNGQQINIPYNKLKNIYLEKSNKRIIFKKHQKYFLIILYKTPGNNICDISLPVSLLEKKDIENLFNHIVIKDNNINYQEKCTNYKINRFLKKMALLLILTLIIICIYFFR